MYRLRKELSAVGAKIKVFKNKLVEKALPVLVQSESGFVLRQSNAFVFCSKENIDSQYDVAKILYKYKKSDTERFRGALDFQNKIIGIEELKRWAKLPTRLELIKAIFSRLIWELINFVNVLENLKIQENNEKT